MDGFITKTGFNFDYLWWSTLGFSSGLNHLEPGGQNRTDLFPTNPGDWSDLKIKLSFDWLKSCFVYLCTRETRDYTGPKLIDHHTSILWRKAQSSLLPRPINLNRTIQAPQTKLGQLQRVLLRVWERCKVRCGVKTWPILSAEELPLCITYPAINIV